MGYLTITRRTPAERRAHRERVALRRTEAIIALGELIEARQLRLIHEELIGQYEAEAVGALHTLSDVLGLHTHHERAELEQGIYRDALARLKRAGGQPIRTT